MPFLLREAFSGQVPLSNTYVGNLSWVGHGGVRPEENELPHVNTFLHTLSSQGYPSPYSTCVLVGKRHLSSRHMQLCVTQGN